MKRKPKSGHQKSGPVNARDFILEVPPPPPVYLQVPLKEVGDVLTPERAREYILEHQFPPVWGQELEGEIRRRLAQAGMRCTLCRCLGEHPVVEMRMTKAPDRPMTVREFKRLIRGIAGQLGLRIAPDSLVASLAGQRVEAAMVLENPAA